MGKMGKEGRRKKEGCGWGKVTGKGQAIKEARGRQGTDEGCGWGKETGKGKIRVWMGKGKGGKGRKRRRVWMGKE